MEKATSPRFITLQITFQHCEEIISDESTFIL